VRRAPAQSLVRPPEVAPLRGLASRFPWTHPCSDVSRALGLGAIGVAITRWSRRPTELALGLHFVTFAMKKLEIEYDERRSLESTVDQLQSLVDGLRSGALTIARGDRRLLFLLKPDAPLEFTLHAERSGDRERLKLSLEWRRQHLRIGGGRAMEEADSAEVAASARELADHEDPSQLEDTDVLEDDDDDFDDAAETLRHGHQLAQALQENPLERH